jgi:hypothetical protein
LQLRRGVGDDGGISPLGRAPHDLERAVAGELGVVDGAAGDAYDLLPRLAE